MAKKKVIDGDNMKCLEEFHEERTVEVLEKYRSQGKWGDVRVDCDGDIILYEEE